MRRGQLNESNTLPISVSMGFFCNPDKNFLNILEVKKIACNKNQVFFF